MKGNNIEAFLFDSGKVLNYPESGHWFISPSFFTYVDKATYESLTIEKKRLAFKKAGEYINSVLLIKTKEEELVHFTKFYSIFSDELPELKLEEKQIQSLANDLVMNPLKYTFYKDALKVIPLLSERYQLAIVSDAWPSLEAVYKAAELKSYFSAFVISSMLGIGKPNEKMYRTALAELNIPPEKAIFIDDNLKNCLGAKQLGIQAALLCRDKKLYFLQKIRSFGKGYRVIQTLEELL